MLALKYLLVILGIGLFGSSGALVVYDIYLSSQLRRLLGRRRSDASGELLPEASAEPDRPLRSGPGEAVTLHEFRVGTPLPGGQPKTLRVAQCASLKLEAPAR